MNHLYTTPNHHSLSQIYCSIVEPDQDLREKLAKIIENESGYLCLDIFDDTANCRELILENPPDVLFMRADLPGIESLRAIKQDLPELEVLMILHAYEHKFIFDSLAAGAAGFINKHKSPKQIIEYIDSILQGGAPMCPQISRMIVDSFHRIGNINLLTQREYDVLTELCKGKSYQLIADHLFISRDTVRSHIKNIYRKLEVNSKTEAVAKALKNHWV